MQTGKLNSRGIGMNHKLAPETSSLYTWEDCLGKRELLWTCGDKKGVKNDLSQVQIDEKHADKSKTLLRY